VRKVHKVPGEGEHGARANHAALEAIVHLAVLLLRRLRLLLLLLRRRRRRLARCHGPDGCVYMQGVWCLSKCVLHVWVGAAADHPRSQRQPLCHGHPGKDSPPMSWATPL
jgi:hypothetical protein